MNSSMRYAAKIVQHLLALSQQQRVRKLQRARTGCPKHSAKIGRQAWWRLKHCSEALQRLKVLCCIDGMWPLQAASYLNAHAFACDLAL